MAKFDLGETIICSVEVRNDAGTLIDPATSTKITITDSSNTIVVNNQSMGTPDAVGKYHYDYNPAVTGGLGKYSVKYIVTDGTRITIAKDTFELE